MALSEASVQSSVGDVAIVGLSATSRCCRLLPRFSGRHRYKGASPNLHNRFRRRRQVSLAHRRP
jgi:hypothetical protein